MTGDVRQQLTEALDEAELAATTCRADVGPDPEHYPSNIFGFDHAELEFMRAWDPATVLRLVGGYREMLDEHRDDRPGWRCACSPSMPCRELKRAAAFWLGTPEADRG